MVTHHDTRAVAFLAIASVLGSSACSNSGSILAPSREGGSAVVLLADAGPVYLTKLDISPLTTVPPFSPRVHDYYVQCSTGTNSLSVTVEASPGAKSLLLQPVLSPSETRQTLSLSVLENQAIVAAATNGVATEEYWVRCLPHDFSSIQMVPHPEVGAVTPGYYLVGDEQADPFGVSYAMVVNNDGVPVWYYRVPVTGVFDVDSVSVGTISFIQWPSTNSTTPFELHSLAPFETSTVSAKGWALDPHELQPMPNGDFLMFTDQPQTGVNLTGYGSGLARLFFGENGTILPCDVLEVNAAGDVVWKWVGTDHFDAVKDSTYQARAAAPDGSTVADPFHCNSIDIDPTNGNLLVSARNMDSVFYIERPSGDVLWKLGGAEYIKDTGATYIPFTNAADAFFRQHDARFQPNWSPTTCGGKGEISVFDDETATGRPARAMVIDVDVGVGCGRTGAAAVWQSAGAASAQFMGSFRILPDGSRVIGWGFGGLHTRVFTEVDIKGGDLLDFYFTDDSWSFRAIKVPITQLDLGLMRTYAGIP
jgi:arylsulfate sulfotransferase